MLDALGQHLESVFGDGLRSFVVLRFSATSATANSAENQSARTSFQRTSRFPRSAVIARS
jgi:hypothetical protein